MSEGIIPLRRRGQERSALARVDVAAMELLVGGQATSLQSARAEVILADMRAQRYQMTVLLADLRGREPAGDSRIDEANANLITAINSGIVQIDLFITHVQVIAAETAQSRLNPFKAPDSL